MGIPVLTQAKRVIIPVGGEFDSASDEIDVISDGAEVEHGQVVAIGGGSYGPMPQFVFSGGATGRVETASVGVDNVTSGGFILNQDRPKEVVDDAERGRVWYSNVWDGSLVSADNGNIVHDWGSQIPSGSKMLVHWVSKINCDAPVFQWKQHRQRPTNGYVDGGPEVCHFGWRGGNGRLVLSRPNPSTSDGDETLSVGLIMQPLATPIWMCYDLYQVLSDQGETNGTYFEQTLFSDTLNTVWDKSDFIHFGASVTDRVRYQIFQNYLGNYEEGESPTVGEVWIDDIAIQVAEPGDDLVRVYLCNTNDITTSTVREYQKPITGWINAAAKVEINRGGLDDGTYYLIAVANKQTQISATQVVLS